MQSLCEYWDESFRKRIIMKPGFVTSKEPLAKKRKLIQFLLDYDFTDQAVVEIGPGTGYVSQMMNKLYPTMNYTGVDASNVSIEYLRKHNLNVMQGNAKELVFPNDSIDVLWLFDVMEHFELDVRAIIYDELARVLRPNGGIFINNPTFKSKHDAEFEWILSDLDISVFGQDVDAKIVRWEQYVIEETAIYEFIVMVKK